MEEEEELLLFIVEHRFNEEEDRTGPEIDCDLIYRQTLIVVIY